MNEQSQQTLLQEIRCCDLLNSEQLAVLVEKALPHTRKPDGRVEVTLPLSSCFKFSQRDYRKLVTLCLNAARNSAKELEKVVDGYDWLVFDRSVAGHDLRSGFHSMCENLVELLNLVGCFDQSASLNYLLQKVHTEILSIPFEKHLAASLNVEIKRPSSNQLFYFPYLDNLLNFVEQIPIFFRYYRLGSLLRESSGRLGSQIEGIAGFKIGNKFGDAEDLTILTISSRVAAAKVLAFSSKQTVVSVPELLDMKVSAVNSECLGYQFPVLPTKCYDSCLLKWNEMEETFLATHSKQCRVIPELVGIFFNQSVLELQFGNLKILAPLLFLESLQSHSQGRGSNSHNLNGGGKVVASLSHNLSCWTTGIGKFISQHLRRLGIIDTELELVSNFDKALAQLQDNEGVVDLMDLDLLELFDFLDSEAVKSTQSSSSISSSPTEQRTENSSLGVMLQSRIVKILKIQKRISIQMLKQHLKSQFALEPSQQAIDIELKRLVELQYILFNESEEIQYLP